MRYTSPRIYLDWLLRDAGVVELRHLDGQRATSGTFNDLAALRAAVRDLSASGNLYCTLNGPKPRQVDNRMGGRALKDADIAWICRLPFDFDSPRPEEFRHLAATDAELALAFDAAQDFLQRMSARGWPFPLRGESGNGFHLQWRCRLPANDETREMLTAIYTGLWYESQHFDRTVRNPSRIFRLYGTINRKGVQLPDRPHRAAACIIPDQWRQVSRQHVEQLAGYFSRVGVSSALHGRDPEMPRPHPAVTGNGDYCTLDVASWFATHGLYKRSLYAGKHAVTCPWADEHSTPDHPLGTDTVIWEGGENWPTFHCSHDHCAGRTIRHVMGLWGDADGYCSAVWESQS